MPSTPAGPFNVIPGTRVDKVAVPWCIMSAGTATYGTAGRTTEELVRAADVAMYRAKEGGRDRVCDAVSGDQEPASAQRQGQDWERPGFVAEAG